MALRCEKAQPWGHAATQRTTRSCIFNSSLFFFTKEQILYPCHRLDGPGIEDRTVTLWHWQMSKPLGAIGGGDKTISGIRPGHQNYRGCCAFQYTDERQMEEHSLVNTLHQRGKDMFPSLPLPAQTQFLRMGLRKQMCPRHIYEALLYLLIFRLFTPKPALVRQTMTTNFHLCNLQCKALSWAPVQPSAGTASFGLAVTTGFGCPYFLVLNLICLPVFPI